MSGLGTQHCTFVYKHIGGAPVLLDVYSPHVVLPQGYGHHVAPALIYFHGGGLTVGNRESWFPTWLYNRLAAAGIAFISADYRLIPPSAGHDILEDIKDAVLFVSNQLNIRLLQQDQAASPSFQINPKALGVAGTSAGGLCAYLAAIHVSPKLKVVLSMYGMGGNFFTPHYLYPKSEVFFRGRELLLPESFAGYLHPHGDLLTTSDSALLYHPESSETPRLPANPRMYLARLYLQLGIYLDYYTGCHDPSLTASLRDVMGAFSSSATNHETPSGSLTNESILELLKSRIQEQQLPLFPQFAVLTDWPPTLLVHGSADSAVLVDESRHMHALLQRAGANSMLKVIPGEDHSFDYQHDAEVKFGGAGGLFDDVAGFIVRSLQV